MQVDRESFYRCTFTSSFSRRVAHVRAWDTTEALQLFHTELRADGVDEPGTTEAVPFRSAGEAARAEYQP